MDKMLSAVSKSFSVMLMKQYLSRFNQYQSRNEGEKAAKVLDNWSAQLSPKLFVASSSEYSPSDVEFVITAMIPYADHNDATIRTRVRHFSNHWLAIATSFCPRLVISACEANKVAGFPPSGQAILLTWFAHALSVIPKTEQEEYVKLCQSMTLHSTAATLKDVPLKFWNFLREYLSVEELSEMLLPLSHPELAPAAAFICGKSMQRMAKSILSIAPLSFVAKFLAHLEKNVDRFDITCVCERVANSLPDQNSSIVSGGIEVLIQLLNFLWWEPNEEERMFLMPLCYAMRRIIDTSSTLSIHRAGCIEALTEASSHGIMAFEDVLPFIDFGETAPAPIQLSCLKVSFKILERSELHESIFNFYRMIVKERDPILFAEFLSQFAESYAKLREIDEMLVIDLLNLSMCPLPAYHVEQVRIIRLLEVVPREHFNDDRIIVKPGVIIREFMKKPAPSVVRELKILFHYWDIEIYAPQLSWFGEDISVSFELVSEMDPRMVLELLDAGLVPPACFSRCMDILTNNSNMETQHCFEQCAILLNSYLATMGSDLSINAKKYRNDVASLWMSRNTIADLFKLTNTLITESLFGKVLDSVMTAISVYLPMTDVTFRELVELADIVLNIIPAFPASSCMLLSGLFAAANKLDSQNRDKQRIIHKITIHYEKFMAQNITSDLVAIAQTAIDIFGIDKCLTNYPSLVISAAHHSRTVATVLSKRKLDIEWPPMRSFLSFMNKGMDDWIAKCKSEIPFKDWLLVDTDFYIVNSDDLSGVDVRDLDEEHRSFLKKVVKHGNGEKSFSVSPVAIEKGFVMHKGGEDSLHSVISFLWFSDLPLPIEFGELEAFCLEHCSCDRLVLGFLNYAVKNSMEIKTDEWLKRYTLKRLDDTSVLAAITLMSFVHCSWDEMPETVGAFISKCCALLGIYDLDVEMLAHQYGMTRGMEKQLIYALMKVDPATFTPFVAQDSTEGKRAAVNSIVTNLEMALSDTGVKDAYTTLVTSVFGDCSFSQSPRITLPSGMRNVPLTWIKFDDMNELQPVGVIDEEIAASFITQMHEFYVKPEFLSIFLNCPLSPDLKQTLMELVEVNAESSNLCLLTMLRKRAKTDEISAFLDSRPPSATRTLYRLTHCIAEVPNSEIWGDSELRKSFKVIHPEFGYKNMGIGGFNIRGEATPLSRARCGFIDVASSLREMARTSHETIAMFESLAQYFSSDLADTLAFTDASAASIDAAKRLHTHILGGVTDYGFIVDAFRCISKCLSIEKLALMFSSREFFNSVNILTVCLLFRMFEKFVEAEKDEERIDMCRLFRDPESMVFADADRIKVFNECVGNEQLVTEMLKL